MPGGDPTRSTPSTAPCTWTPSAPVPGQPSGAFTWSRGQGAWRTPASHRPGARSRLTQPPGPPWGLLQASALQVMLSLLPLLPSFLHPLPALCPPPSPDSLGVAGPCCDELLLPYLEGKDRHCAHLACAMLGNVSFLCWKELLFFITICINQVSFYCVYLLELLSCTGYTVCRRK